MMEAHTAQFLKQKITKGLVSSPKKADEAGRSDMMLYVTIPQLQWRPNLLTIGRFHS